METKNNSNKYLYFKALYQTALAKVINNYLTLIETHNADSWKEYGSINNCLLCRLNAGMQIGHTVHADTVVIEIDLDCRLCPLNEEQERKGSSLPCVTKSYSELREATCYYRQDRYNTRYIITRTSTEKNREKRLIDRIVKCAFNRLVWIIATARKNYEIDSELMTRFWDVTKNLLD